MRADTLPPPQPVVTTPVERVLAHLAQSSDPLVRTWATALLADGERADSSTTHRPRNE